MRIYTKKGDGGTTSLLRGGRVPKDDLRVSAYGDLDELNAAIGMAASVEKPVVEPQLLSDIQRDLLSLGSMLAIGGGTDASELDDEVTGIAQARIEALEAAIDATDEILPPLDKFVIPGGCPEAAFLHHARTVCRRAERSTVELGGREPLPQLALPYLNRLSDLLFVLARLANSRAGVSEPTW